MLFKLTFVRYQIVYRGDDRNRCWSGCIIARCYHHYCFYYSSLCQVKPLIYDFFYDFLYLLLIKLLLSELRCGQGLK